MRRRLVSSFVAVAVMTGGAMARAQSADEPHAANVPAVVNVNAVAPSPRTETASAPSQADGTAPETAPAPTANPAASQPGQSANGGSIQTEQVPVAGTTVLAGRVRTEVHAPYATVANVVTDFAHYRDFFPQMRDSRVIHRRRGQADVYLRVELMRGLGMLWALTRFNVQRASDATVVDGTLVDGNLRRLDVRFEVRPVSGDASRAEVTMQVLGVPTFFFPDGVLSSQQARWASRSLELLRARAEALAEPQAALR